MEKKNITNSTTPTNDNDIANNNNNNTTNNDSDVSDLKNDKVAYEPFDKMEHFMFDVFLKVGVPEEDAIICA